MKFIPVPRTTRNLPRIPRRIGSAIRIFAPALAALGSLALTITPARASIAYGSLNNFDTVNDTGVEAHGFEIELDDIHSTDITYTYDYNHYGAPKITEDKTDPLHPKVFIRYAATYVNGAWSAYTAVPSGPIAPTQGHQFTDPSVNFGGEHFGVGYSAVPTAVKYNWLIDDGRQNLVQGPPVNVATPTFAYAPPAAAVPAQVVAQIVPPPPPVRPSAQFGDPVWVKEIKTKTHSPNKIRIEQLVGDDPGKPQPWANGVDVDDPTQIEVEIEWRLLQTDFNDVANPKGFLQGAAEDLPEGNEVITRRYEFYKYTGPLDWESNEAVADTVAADGIHGAITVTYNSGFDVVLDEPIVTTVDTSTLEIVGDFIGSQMAAYDVNGALGLIEHVQDGDIHVPYVERKVVVAGNSVFQATVTGALPAGLTLDPVTGILSGTPTRAGLFTFEVSATDSSNASVKKSYTMAIADNGVLPPSSSILTMASPDVGGSTKGSGTYFNGTNVSVTAMANAGYNFVDWTENGVEVSASAVYNFVAGGDRTLVANFAPAVKNFTVSTSASDANLGTTSGGGTYADGSSVTVTATANAGATFIAWTEGGNLVSNSPSYTFNVTADRALVASFLAVYNVTTSASPANGGSTTGDGPVNDGSSVTVTATPNAGFAFVNWTEAGTAVSASPSYTFTVSGNRVLVANFVQMFAINTAASPIGAGGTSGDGVYAAGSLVTVVATPSAGYTFSNWTESGAIVSNSASYSFTATAPRALVANFQAIVVTITTATYNGLVTNFISPTASMSGLLTISTTTGSQVFTAKLLFAGVSYSFKGTLDPMNHATVKVPRKGLPTLLVDLNLTATGFAGTVSDGTTSVNYAARVCPYTTANPIAGWPGSYTHLIGFPRTQRPPLPVGTGTHTITATGAVRVTGKLSDGTSYSCSSLVTDAGSFPLYSATALSKVTGFLVSNVALDAANVGSIANGSPLTWKPATTQPFGRFAFYMSHFTPVPRGTTVLKVDPGVHNLDILATNPSGGWTGDSWQMMLGTDNVAVDLKTYSPISLSIDGTTGIVSGKTTIGGASRAFTGVVWQDSNRGFAIFPKYQDQATLTLVPIYTGP